jgi:hypothetical protein
MFFGFCNFSFFERRVGVWSVECTFPVFLYSVPCFYFVITF